MGLKKITEKEKMDEVLQEASILITQPAEDENGLSVESVRRASLKTVVEALQETEIKEGLLPLYNTRKYDDILIEQKVVTEVFATNEELISSEGKVFAKFSDLPKTLSGLSKNPREIAKEIDTVCSGLLVAGDYIEFGNASVRYGNYVWLVDESDTSAEFSESDTGCTGNTIFPEVGIYVLLWYWDGNSFMLSEDTEFSIKFKGELKKLDNEFLSEDVYVYDDEVKEGSTKAVTSDAVAKTLKKIEFSGVQFPENIVSNVTELPENPKINDLVSLTKNQIVNWDKVKIWNSDNGIVPDDGSFFDFEKVTEVNLASIGVLPNAIDLSVFEGKNVYSAVAFYNVEKGYEIIAGITNNNGRPMVLVESRVGSLFYMLQGGKYLSFTAPKDGWYFNDDTGNEVRQATEGDLSLFKSAYTSVKILDFVDCAMAASEDTAEALKDYETSPYIALDLFLSSVITILKPAGFYISKEIDGEIKWVPYVDTTITSITESTEDSGGNVVTFLNGQTLTIKNGSKGIQGEKGEKGDTGEQGVPGERGADGYTPVKGTDYFTEEDKTELVNSILAALPIWQGGSY